MNTNKLFIKINDYTFIDVSEIKAIRLVEDAFKENIFKWEFRVGNSDFSSYDFYNVEEAIKWLEDIFKGITNFYRGIGNDCG